MAQQSWLSRLFVWSHVIFIWNLGSVVTMPWDERMPHLHCKRRKSMWIHKTPELLNMIDRSKEKLWGSIFFKKIAQNLDLFHLLNTWKALSPDLQFFFGGLGQTLGSVYATMVERMSIVVHIIWMLMCGWWRVYSRARLWFIYGQKLCDTKQVCATCMW